MVKMGSKEHLSLADALWFTSAFVSRMRIEKEVYFPPTCRQSVSIPGLLSSRYLRRGTLNPHDLVQAAVVTSQPEDQSTAYRVAMTILFGSEEKGEEEEIRPYLVKVRQSSAGASGGDQLFLEWLQKLRMDKDLQRRLREMSEHMHIWSDSRCDHLLLTREDSGPLEGEKLSVFRWGDDPELVDFEESLDSLLAQGKQPGLARYEDLIVRQRRGQRKAVVILQDISASMNYALRFSKIYGAVLMYALQKHEVACAFFESNDYVIKRFFDNKPVDEAIAAMLSATTKMGTMGEYALRWARKELAKVDGRYHERECIILSDFGFDDMDRVATEIERLVKMDVRVVIILPPAYIYRSCLEKVEKYRCPVVELDADKMEAFVATATQPSI